ncbi:MAG: hypothetical protein N2314_01630 [Brevinematales bacterium]|nr:hypothetical protein [Brevinematales bacterium]
MRKIVWFVVGIVLGSLAWSSEKGYEDAFVMPGVQFSLRAGMNVLPFFLARGEAGVTLPEIVRVGYLSGYVGYGYSVLPFFPSGNGVYGGVSAGWVISHTAKETMVAVPLSTVTVGNVRYMNVVIVPGYAHQRHILAGSFEMVPLMSFRGFLSTNVGLVGVRYRWEYFYDFYQFYEGKKIRRRYNYALYLGPVVTPDFKGMGVQLFMDIGGVNMSGFEFRWGGTVLSSENSWLYSFGLLLGWTF